MRQRSTTALDFDGDQAAPGVDDEIDFMVAFAPVVHVANTRGTRIGKVGAA